MLPATESSFHPLRDKSHSWKVKLRLWWAKISLTDVPVKSHSKSACPFATLTVRIPAGKWLFHTQCWVQIEEEKMEAVTDFIFSGFKITVDGDCTHEIKECLLLGREDMINLNSVLKSRDIILPTKVCILRGMVFPVVMFECENWTIKKSECWRLDAF